MDWRIKALIQKFLSVTQLGDKMNHFPITLNKNYNRNVAVYQSHEALRKFNHANLDMRMDMTALEIGTGYSMLSAMILALLGFNKVITVDITKDISFTSFKKQLKHFNNFEFTEKILSYSKYSPVEINEKLTLINKVSSLQDLFSLLNIVYIAPYELADIENHATRLDYITSQVAFEHISPSILDALFEKTKSWLSEDGYCVHTINFIDHFANPGILQDKSISEFNFLKYSNRYWNFWAGNSIAYTNRLSYLFYLELCKKYDIEIVDFIGENYRNRIEVNLSMIHEDILKKYHKTPNRDQLIRFQRGTLILKGKQTNSIS